MTISPTVLGRVVMAANTSLRKKVAVSEIVNAMDFWLKKGGYTPVEAIRATDQWRKNHGF